MLVCPEKIWRAPFQRLPQTKSVNAQSLAQREPQTLVNLHEPLT